MNKIYTIIAAIGLAAPAHARDNIQIAGSSTVLPYASIVAEAFGENTDYPTPVVESGGSGAGQRKLCLGVGINTVDIANSSSLMTEETWKKSSMLFEQIAHTRCGTKSTQIFQLKRSPCIFLVQSTAHVRSSRRK